MVDINDIELIVAIKLILRLSKSDHFSIRNLLFLILIYYNHRF